MKKIAIAAAVLVLAGALAYWFGFRDRGGAKATAKGPADPWDQPAKAKPKGDATPAAGGGGDRSGRMPRLSYEVDPDGPLLMEGQVLDEQDKPVAGAEVRISSTPGRVTKTDTDGSFSFDKLLGRTYGVSARAGDKVGFARAKVTAAGEPVIIRLHAGIAVTVSVTDAADHKPIKGARVMRGGDGENLDEVTTGADGKALIRGVDDGWLSVTASADGYGPATSTKRVGGDPHAVIEVALSKGSPLSGRVVDEQGAGIGGARVWASESSNAWQGGAGEKLAVTSAKDGSFTIPALATGTFVLYAKDEVHAPAITPPIQVSGESPTTGITVVLKEAAVLAGVVVSGDGTPVPYASVKLSSKRQSPDMTYRQVAADDKGTFEVKGLPRTALRLRAESDEASSAAVDVDLATGASKRDIKLVLDITGTIAGIVVDESGEPIAEANVTCFPDFMSGEKADGDFILASEGTATTDGGGRFVLHGLEKGKYRVWAGRDGVRRRRSGNAGTQAETGATDVKVTLPSPGGVKGKIAMEDGKVPELAVVSSDWEHRVTTRDGTFQIDDLGPGKYDLRVTGADFAERVQGDVEVTAGKITDAGTITVRRGRTISGVVRDSKGAPVQGARVLFGKLMFGDGKQTGADDAETAATMGMKMGITNAAGEFTLRGARRSPGSLLAEHATTGRSIAIKIPQGTDDISGVQIALKGYGRVTGTVTRNGAPIEGGSVNAAPVGSGGQATFVQMTGNSFAIDKVPEGRTAINVSINQGFGSTGGSRTVTVVAGETVDASFDIPTGNLTLTAKIEARAGAQVDAAQVFLFRGTVAVHNAEELTQAFLAADGVEAAEGQSTVEVGGAAAMVFWLGAAMPAPKFTEVLAGSYSVCAIPITGNLMADNGALSQRIFANLEKLEVVCTPVAIKSNGQSMTMPLPTMVTLPANPDDE